MDESPHPEELEGTDCLTNNSCLNKLTHSSCQHLLAKLFALVTAPLGDPLSLSRKGFHFSKALVKLVQFITYPLTVLKTKQGRKLVVILKTNAPHSYSTVNQIQILSIHKTCFKYTVYMYFGSLLMLFCFF